MKKILLMGLLGAGLAAEQAFAGTVTVPEIDGGGAVLAIGLTAGLLALIRERKRKK